MSETRPLSALSVRGAARLPWAVVLGLLLVAGGCQQVPAEHVRLYAETTSQTRAAGGIVLDQIAPIVGATAAGTDTQDCGPDPTTRIPRCFNLQLVAGAGPAGRADPPSVAVHRVALDLVAAYAQILADLAEGRSAAEVQRQIGLAADIAGSLVTLTGVGAPVGAAIPVLLPQIQALATRLETARAGAVIRQSLIADRDTIKAVLKGLENETPGIYEVFKAKSKLDLLAAARNRDQAAVEAVVDRAGRFHAALDAYVRLLRTASAAIDTLAREAQQAGRPSAESVQAALKQAIEARAEALALFNTVRQLEGTRR
jgi:hypothetical protein